MFVTPTTAVISEYCQYKIAIPLKNSSFLVYPDSCLSGLLLIPTDPDKRGFTVD